MARVKKAATLRAPSVEGVKVISLFDEVGRTGLKRWAGLIDEEYDPALSGTKAIKTYTDLRDNDPVVGAGLLTIQQMMRQVDWHVVKNLDDPYSDESALFLEECMEDLDWGGFITEAVSFLTFGWAYFEIVYQKRVGKTSRYQDGAIGWKKFAIRAQDTLDQWDFNEETGDLRGMWQSPPPDYKRRYIPLEKAILLRTQSTKDNPCGRSILHNVTKPAYFKRRMQMIEAIGIERDLSGYPIARVPTRLLSKGASESEKALAAQIRNMVTRLRRDENEGLVFPLEYDERGNEVFKIELINSGGRRAIDTSGIIDRYTKEIAMAMLTDFLLIGYQKTATPGAASEVSGSTFAIALGGWLDIIRDTINDGAVKKLFEMNGLPTNALPKIEHGELETPDLQTLGAFVGQLTAAGMRLFPDPGLEDHIRRIGKLPPRTVESPESVDPYELQAGLDAGVNPFKRPEVRAPGSRAGAGYYDAEGAFRYGKDTAPAGDGALVKAVESLVDELQNGDRADAPPTK